MGFMKNLREKAGKYVAAVGLAATLYAGAGVVNPGKAYAEVRETEDIQVVYDFSSPAIVKDSKQYYKGGYICLAADEIDKMINDGYSLKRLEKRLGKSVLEYGAKVNHECVQTIKENKTYKKYQFLDSLEEEEYRSKALINESYDALIEMTNNPVEKVGLMIVRDKIIKEIDEDIKWINNEKKEIKDIVKYVSDNTSYHEKMENKFKKALEENNH